MDGFDDIFRSIQAEALQKRVPKDKRLWEQVLKRYGLG